MRRPDGSVPASGATPGEGAERRPKVGLVGLGLLGSAIADRLRAEGYEVHGHDLDPRKLSTVGVEPASSPAELARRVERVVLSLPDSDAVEGVVEGPGGLAGDRVCPGLVLDTTTGDPERSRALARRLRARGALHVDAAVSGSSEDMRRGEAVLLVGGAEDAIARARDLLEALAPVVFRLGQSGSGLLAKLAVNQLLGLERLALAETLAFAERLGIDPETLLEVLRAGPAQARVLDTKGPQMARREYRPPRARLSQHLKDVRLILEEGRRRSAELPLTGLHRELLERAVRLGHGDGDNAAVIEALRESVRGDDGDRRGS